jgi:3-hydroxybutyryl-CoA dehydratase
MKVNDEITACVEVIALLDKNHVRLKTSCINQEGVIVLEGEALVISPDRSTGIEAYES